MGIVGEHPESGVRVEVARPREGGPPWRYEGALATAAARFALVAVVAEDRAVDLALDGLAPAGLAEQARLLVRAACRRGDDDEAAPPRRIVRWRPAR